MKTVQALALLLALGLVSCSNENLSAPTVSPEKGGPQAEAPQIPAGGTSNVVLDGTWKTKCMNNSIQTIYKPYIAEIVFQDGYFYQGWTSYSDQECTKQVGEDFTVLFTFAIGSEIRTGVKTFDYSWELKDEAGNVTSTGKEYNIINVTEKTLKFFPLYENPADEFDGTTPEKRFQTFLNPNLGYEEEYVRQ